jgi:hypothetical protein
MNLLKEFNIYDNEIIKKLLQNANPPAGTK